MIPPDPQTWLAGRDLLRVVALRDPAVERTGHHPCSNYVELFYLGFLGPAATVAARRLSTWLELSPEGFTVPAAILARQLGLGTGGGRHAPLTKTLARLAGFGLAEVIGERYAVRLAFPPLTPRQVRRLTPPLAEAHQRIARPDAAPRQLGRDHLGMATSCRCPAPVGEAGPGSGTITRPVPPAALATTPGGLS
jgi:hypothetical protein